MKQRFLSLNILSNPTFVKIKNRMYVFLILVLEWKILMVKNHLLYPKLIHPIKVEINFLNEIFY
jgi:hypothetical protein